jgi:hypothetical protein
MPGDRFRTSPAVRASISADGLVPLDVDDGHVVNDRHRRCSSSCWIASERREVTS